MAKGVNSSAPTTGEVVAGVYNAVAPTLQDGQACAIQLDVNGQVKTTGGGGGGGGNVNITGINGTAPALNNPLAVELSDGTNALGTVGNPVFVSGGSGSNASVGTNGAAAPASSTQAGGSDGTNLQPLQVDGSKNLKVAVNVALPAGTNVIGHVITDAGSTTAVTGVVNVGLTALTNNNAAPAPSTQIGTLGAVANAANPSWTEGNQVLESVDLAGNTRVKVNVALPAGAAIIGKVGIDQTTPGTTNGVQVNAALPAGANVIGHVIADTGSTTAVTGNVTAVQATGTNLHVVADTGSTTAVTGNVTAVQATGTNLHVVVDTAPSTAVTNAGTFAVQATLAAETTKVIGTVRCLGNVGGVFDAATAATAPANAIQAGMRGSTTVPTAVTDGQLVGARGDKYGNHVVVQNAPRDLIATAILNSSSSSSVSFIGAGAANVFNDIISLVITNESSTATIATLTDNGSGGNTYKFAIAANGGIVINFPTPLPQGTAAVAWQVLNSAAVALDWVAVYAKNK